MTLIEVLVATVIVVFAIVAIIQFHLSSIWLSETNKEQTIATAHLVNMAEAVKCTPFSNIIVKFPNGVANGTVNNNYTTVVGGYALKGEQIIVSYVNTTSDPLEIMINASWQDKKGVTRAKYLVTKRTR
jgi:Tfp pilus assembly protein PilV